LAIIRVVGFAFGDVDGDGYRQCMFAVSGVIVIVCSFHHCIQLLGGV
jgi:hypothetical protein